jgi:hypothetical protein
MVFTRYGVGMRNDVRALNDVATMSAAKNRVGTEKPFQHDFAPNTIS